MLYVAAAHAVHVPGGDHVQGHGDDTHAVLREREQIEAGKSGRVQAHAAQHGAALFQRVHSGVPDAGVLGGSLASAGALQLVGAAGQAPGQVQVLEER